MATLLAHKASCLRQVARDTTLFNTSRRQRGTFATCTTRQLARSHVDANAARPSFLHPVASSSSQNVLKFSRRTYSASSNPATQPTPAASSATSSPSNELTWNHFFTLRRRRRYINMGASVICAAVAVSLGGPLIASQDIDTWGAQISGIDPIFVFGASTFAIAVGGWLCGPTFGGALFKLWAGRKGWANNITEKEKSFFSRIKRYRADPSSSSPQNPIPDYYGEKIGSVAGYRSWLKDQRAFNRKMYRGVRTSYGIVR